MDEYFPTKTARLQNHDKTWMTAEIKVLIQEHQKAFSQKNTVLWNKLRNKTQCKIRTTRQAFYSDEITALKKLNPEKWHQEVKALANIFKFEPTFTH